MILISIFLIEFIRISINFLMQVEFMIKLVTRAESTEGLKYYVVYLIIKTSNIQYKTTIFY